MSNIVNERSDAEIVISSYNPSGQLASVSAMEYRIDDIQTGVEVRDWTEIETPSSTTTIELTPSDTTIINARNKDERKRITTKVTYASSKVHYSDFIYIVRAMEGVS